LARQRSAGHRASFKLQFAQPGTALRSAYARYVACLTVLLRSRSRRSSRRSRRPAPGARPEAGVALQKRPGQVINRFIVDLRGPIAGYSAGSARIAMQHVSGARDGLDPTVSMEGGGGQATRCSLPASAL
jgi:hypothetical protein